MSGFHSFLDKVGLDRPELRAWAMYDWANSAFVTVVITAVFPIYYNRVAAAGTTDAVARHAWTTTIALAVVAVLSPVLGAIADYLAIKKRMLAGFMFLGVAATATMYFVGEGDWLLASALFTAGNLGVLLSLTFCDSLLPHIASGEEMDRVSTAGYALGYLGGGVLLALDLLLIQKPGLFGIADTETATRIAFVTVALWWLLFSIPVLRRVPEPPRELEADERADENPVGVALRRLGETFHELRSYRQTFLLLVAVLVYNDGITTIYRMATTFGAEIGLSTAGMITAILMVQFVGIPCSFLFGGLAGRIGPKRGILCGLFVYAAISVFGYFLRTEVEFYVLAGAVGVVQGGTQALSRSLFASMVPRHKSSEFFGFYGVAERFSAIFGPALFGVVQSATGSIRNAVLSVIVFFIVGGLLLTRVDVDSGRRAAREADRRLLTGEGT